MAEEIEFRYDTQLLIDAKDIDEDELDEYIREHFVGDSLLVIADEDTAKLHFHTNEPWKILEYCATLGEIYDIVVEDMIRQSRGEKG
ncbi:MAG: kinase to dihydroxyacetone kinase [Oscillospiraceae bacterium]|nr:kinase to dihydroxyacetone kinase [Oscillospiraceae bacterium]